MKITNKEFTFLSVFLLVILVLRVLYAFYNNNLSGLLWFCVWTLFLLILGLYFKNLLLISSVAISSLIIELVWTLDAISYLIRGKLLIGIGLYLLKISEIGFIMTFYHLLLLIIPFYVLIKLRKFSSYSWIVSSLFFLFVSLITLIFTDSSANCVRFPCELGALNFIYFFKPNLIPLFIFHWIILTFIIFIPSYFLIYFFFRRKEMKKDKLLTYFIEYFLSLDFILFLFYFM